MRSEVRQSTVAAGEAGEGGRRLVVKECLIGRRLDVGNRDDRSDRHKHQHKREGTTHVHRVTGASTEETGRSPSLFSRLGSQTHGPATESLLNGDG